MKTISFALSLLAIDVAYCKINNAKNDKTGLKQKGTTTTVPISIDGQDRLCETLSELKQKVTTVHKSSLSLKDDSTYFTFEKNSKLTYGSGGSELIKGLPGATPMFGVKIQSVIQKGDLIAFKSQKYGTAPTRTNVLPTAMFNSPTPTSISDKDLNIFIKEMEKQLPKLNIPEAKPTFKGFLTTSTKSPPSLPTTVAVFLTDIPEGQETQGLEWVQKEKLPILPPSKEPGKRAVGSDNFIYDGEDLNVLQLVLPSKSTVEMEPFL
jgi:hypothetical protein